MMSSLRGVTKRIQAIKFALLSPDEIRRMSATKIITADTYDDDGFPIDMGLMDSHLGVIEPGLRCKTCGGKVDDCPGHFGHIDLAMPVIHVGYVKDIKKLLQATCRKCGRLLLTRQQAQEYMAEMEQVEELGGDVTEVGFVTKETAREAQKRQRCPHCGEEQGKVTLDKPTTFREDGHKLTPKEVRERLERIPNEDLRVLGMNPEVARPEWMVLTALLVPPVTVRPSITLESGDRSEDDLTHKLVDVLRINQRLRENRDAGAPQLIVEDLWELLQYHVTTYFDNQTSGIPPARHRSGRPLKTLVQRLKGKEGRFRSNLSGKRVNFSARTVISQDRIRRNDGAGREVHPLAGQIRSEAAFLSLQPLHERLQRPSGPVPRRRDARRLVVEVRRHVILEQLPKVLDDQLGRTRVPVLAQTLVDPQDVDELVREVVLRAVAALEGDRRTHGDGRDEQRGQDHPLGPGDLGVHPEDPEVFVRDPLEALAHLFRCELVTVLAERRRLVESDLSLFLAAMGTALPLLRFAGGLLRDEANLRHVAAELLDLLHLRHVLLRLLAREEEAAALPARRLEELLDVLHVPDVDHRHREIDVAEVTRAIVDLPAARLAPETGLDDPEMGIHQAHVDRESIVVVRVRRDDLRRRHPADLIGAQESELDRLDPLRDPPH